MHIDPNIVERLRVKYHSLNKEGKFNMIANMSAETVYYLKYYTEFFLRDKQLVGGIGREEKFLNVFIGGRGSGKNFLSSVWLRQNIYKLGGMKHKAPNKKDPSQVLLVAANHQDLETFMIPDICAAFPPDKQPVRNEYTLTFFNGLKAVCGTSGQNIRGGNIQLVWLDEVGKWCDGIEEKTEEKYNTILDGVRKGSPKVVITGNPVPTKLMKSWQERGQNNDPHLNFISTSMYENVDNLSKDYVEERLANTPERRRRQELGGELLFDVPGALWNFDLIQSIRLNVKETVEKLDKEIFFRKIVIGVDPATTDKKSSDDTGIVVVARDQNNYLYLLEDCSGKYSPNEWSKIVSKKYNDYNASLVVAETNQGGDLVTEVLKSANKNMVIKTVHATKGKILRAESILALFERKEVFFVGEFPELEYQMITFDGNDKAISPDRLDALVYAVSYCRLTPTVDYRRNFGRLGL